MLEEPMSDLFEHNWDLIVYANVTNHTMGEHSESLMRASKALVFLFATLAAGAVARQLLKSYHLPYTVVMFLLGIVIGLLSFKFKKFRSFTELTRMDASIIMQVFLPTLIFESAYSMDTHLFLHSLPQCIVLALPGVVICALLIASYAMTALSFFEWDWVTALLFGSILSATDPVAVVALFKESGISPKLTTLIEGESLLNDGAAIVAFDILLDLLIYNVYHKELELSVGEMVYTFVKVGVAAPIFGYFMGILAAICLLQVFKDAVVEFTITFCFAYITYYVSEITFHISGVLAVVVLGVKISYHKNNFSPETEHSVHCFWEMLSYFANTLIFMIVGVIIAEEVSQVMTMKDAALAFCTYLYITFARLVMILVLSPILKRLGYGLPWKNAIALVWGGLRGAVGMALAVMLVQNPAIDDVTIAHRIIIQLSICIVLTLVINGTTMERLLTALGMKQVSQSHRISMGNAISRLRDTAAKSQKVQMRNKYLSGANWLWVESNIQIKDPYKNSIEFDMSVNSHYRKVRCAKCEETYIAKPTEEERKEMEEEARIRALTAITSSIWNNFEHSLITKETVKILTTLASEALDKPEAFIDTSQLEHKYMSIPNIYLKFREHVMRIGAVIKADEILALPASLEELSHEMNTIRLYCWKTSIHPFFEPFIIVVLLLNMIPMFFNTFTFNLNAEELLAINSALLLFYFLEALIKIVALGWRNYFKSFWNIYAILILLLGVFDLAAEISLLFHPWTSYEIISYIRILRLLRLLEIYKQLRILVAYVVLTIKNSFSLRLYNAFDLGLALLSAEEELLNKIDFVENYKPCGSKPVKEGEQCILEMIKALNHIENLSPGVAIALKSHRAALNICNDVIVALREIFEDGIIDEVEFERLSHSIEQLMLSITRSSKRLDHSDNLPDIIKKIDWISDPRLIDAIVGNYVVQDYKAHQTLSNVGDKSKSIAIIISGVVQVRGKTTDKKTNCLPNTDSLNYFNCSGVFFDYISTLQCLGILGFLSGQKLATLTKCETDVRIVHVSYETLRKVERITSPPLSYLLWKDIALKIALPILHTQPRFQAINIEKLRIQLETAVFPDLSNSVSFDIDEGVNAVILIQGKARDATAGTLFVGPEYVHSLTRSLYFDDDPSNRPRIVLLLLTETNYVLPEGLDWSGYDSMEKQSTLCMQHAIQRRLSSIGSVLYKPPPSTLVKDLRRRLTGKADTSSTLPLRNVPS